MGKKRKDHGTQRIAPAKFWDAAWTQSIPATWRNKYMTEHDAVIHNHVPQFQVPQSTKDDVQKKISLNCTYR